MGGGDKCLLPMNGKSLIAHVLAAIAPQTGDILINTNNDPAAYLKFGMPVLPDVIPGFQGPLAGLLTGMLWSRRRHPRQAYILSVAGDVPLLPPDLVAQLARNLSDQKADIAIARCAQGLHPTTGLWPVDLADRLEHDLMETALRAMREWSGQFRVAEVTFASASLININTPAELAACRGPLAQAI
jgi:molybdopterin-guanine dinucleotide biosynthesis protein A